MTAKSIENKLRRQLAKDGLRLVKSRVKNTNGYNFGEYCIVDVYSNAVVAGACFDLSLEDVQHFIAK